MRDQEAPGSEEATAGIFHAGNGISVERQSAANVGDDYVGAFGEFESAGIALKELDAIGEVVRVGELSGVIDDVGGVHREHASRASAGREHGEDGWSAADFENDVPWPNGLSDRSRIGGEAGRVGNHAAEIAKRVVVGHLVGLFRHLGL